MNRLELERRHHDKWAAEDSARVASDFEHFLALENRWIMEHLPPLAGRRVLDIGCGLGEASVFFARGGAIVTAVDLSEEMVKHATEAARSEGFVITGVVSSAEDLDASIGNYDVVYMANVLHHLEHPEKMLEKTAGLLRPGGTAFFTDPLRYNPVINVYRRMADTVRTKDERPVGFELLDQAKTYFADVSYSTTWLLSLVIFLKYFLVDRVHPNSDRYWKRILREPEATRRWIGPLIRAEQLLCRLFPPLRYLCWNIVIAARVPAGDEGR